jgi:Flp pilus assembly protein TadG
MSTLMKYWFKSCRGTATMEFALVAPLLLTLWIGIIELSNAHIVGRKAAAGAQAAADLVAQRDLVTPAGLADINAAVNAILAPYPTAGNIGVDIASIETDNDGNLTVGWRFTQGNIQAGGGGIPGVVQNLVTTNDSVIVANLAYLHQPALALVFGNITFNEAAYARPRNVRKIPLQPG